MFGAEIAHDLRDLLVCERVCEGRHLLPAIQDLIRDFCGRPILVFGQASERGSFFAADACDPVAMGTAFVAKEYRASLLRSLLLAAPECMSGL